jgi:hypothetical protein
MPATVFKLIRFDDSVLYRRLPQPVRLEESVHCLGSVKISVSREHKYTAVDEGQPYSSTTTKCRKGKNHSLPFIGPSLATRKARRLGCGLLFKNHHIPNLRIYDFPSYPQVGSGYPSANAIKPDSRLNTGNASKK